MKKTKLKLKWKIILFIILFIMTLFISMRYIGTKGLKVREYMVKNENITSSLYGLKIVHFSDLHYGMSVGNKEVENLTQKINLTKPDIVIFSGDLIDRNTTYTEDVENTLIKHLSKIKSTYGNYYVTGNHDKVNDSYDSLMEKCNFISLDNKYETIYAKDNSTLLLSGIKVDSNLNEEIINTLDEEYDYTILVSHYPDYIDKVKKYGFDLVLSGHSHNGQVRIPFVGAFITPDNAKKYYENYYKIDDTELYISGGIGNSVVNLRLFNRPSFNLYRIVDK